MSHYGRKCVAFDLEQRWREGHEAGKVHPWEGRRILAGDFSPVIRECEPGFEVGSEHVLSRTRPKGSLVLDRSRNVEILYPKPPPEPLFYITIRDVIRHRAGYWRVRFDVFDRRETDFYVRRKPPVYTIGQEEDEVPTAEQVKIDSAYTTNPAQAVDCVSAVPPEVHNILQMRADDNRTKHQREYRNAELAKQQVRTIAQTAREYSISASRLGLDPTRMLAELEMRLASEIKDLEKAA